jgi:hypothetical protein
LLKPKCAPSKKKRREVLRYFDEGYIDRVRFLVVIIIALGPVHVSKILRKLGLASRAQIAAWTTERRLLAPDPD